MSNSALHSIQVIDSHTGGEPTRLVVEGGPDLGDGPLDERLRIFRERFDRFRSAVVNEPRGSDPVVGALLCKPTRADCAAGVIFFNNVGYLGMCGHGTIGLMVSLAHMGRIAPGTHRIETPVGVVEASLLDHSQVRIRNVPSFRTAAGVAVQVEGYGVMHGDVAWGGNWFFLVDDHGQAITKANIPGLTTCAVRLREALERQGITGTDGAAIDHIELVASSPNPDIYARNFVLCPGMAYDRSPCGTGTSAKLACLHAAGKLKIGQVVRIESVIGSVFAGSMIEHEGQVLPVITGSAHVMAEAKLLIDPADSLTWGIA